MNNNEKNKDILDVSFSIFLNENKIDEKKYCQHEWIKDFIDINPEKSQVIFYCVKCEVTRI